MVGHVSLTEVFYAAYDGGRAYAPGLAEGAAASDAGAPPPAPDGHGAAGATRLRRDFRETAYVNPTLITDASGHATVTVPLSHSITTWRVSADGSTTDGRVGSARGHMRTLQPFFVDFTMPGRLTSGDEIEVPAIVYNYTAASQHVTVGVDADDWFDLLSGATQTVDVGPSEVRAAKFRIRVTQAGSHELTVRASAGGVSDGLVRSATVVPAGQPDDQTFSGRVDATAARTHAVDLPADTVAGGGSLTLALTPGFASEAASGVEALLREPTGCFEQTNSSAWPNTLVAKYLDATGELTPDRRDEVIGLVTRGYQRLLTFESPTGGFNWWGDSDPGNRILSAIFLWHLKDLEGLIETDTAVRDRTLSWLLAQQQSDGSWEPGDQLHTGDEVLSTSRARTTAFIAWALAHTGWADDAVSRAATWLRANEPPADDLYANALAANALALADPGGAMTGDLFTRLDRMKEDQGGQNGIDWPTTSPTWTGAGGNVGAIETTGLIAYGMMRSGQFPDDAAGAMQFILANKDSAGTWYDTQATMNALRALSEGLTGGSSDALGTLVVTVDGAEALRADVNADNRDLLRTFDLTSFMHDGSNDVQVSFAGTGKVSYRLTRRAYRPAMPPAAGPLSMTVSYDTTTVPVGTPVNATVGVHSNDTGPRDQVIVRVGRAPGFTPRTEDLDAIVAARLASRYEVRDTDVTFYLMNLGPGETRDLHYRLTPGLPVDATAPASSVYAYYEPTLRQTLPAQHFTATAAP